MVTIREYPARGHLRPGDTSDRITAHSISLGLTLILCWFFVMAISEQFGRDAYLAVEQQDFSGLGAARAEFDIRLILLPLFGFLTYWAIRLALGLGRWLLGKVGKR